MLIVGYVVARFCAYHSLRAWWYSLRQCRQVTFSMCVASPVVPSDFHGSLGSYGYFPASYASVLLFLRSHVLHPQWWTNSPAGVVLVWFSMFLVVSRGRVMFSPLVVVLSSPPCYGRGGSVNMGLAGLFFSWLPGCSCPGDGDV